MAPSMANAWWIPGGEVGTGTGAGERRSGLRIDQGEGSGSGDDILVRVTTKSTSVTTSPARALRSSLRLSVPLTVIGTALLAAPALALPPQGWDTPESVSFMDYFLLVLVFPLALALVITLATVLPMLLRGEKLSGHSTPVNDDWFGGPRGGKAEVEAGAAKDTGGASGTW